MALYPKHQQTLLLLCPLSEQVLLVGHVFQARNRWAGSGPSAAAAELPGALQVFKPILELFWSEFPYSVPLFINLYGSANSVLECKVKALS